MLRIEQPRRIALRDLDPNLLSQKRIRTDIVAGQSSARGSNPPTRLLPELGASRARREYLQLLRKHTGGGSHALYVRRHTFLWTVGQRQARGNMIGTRSLRNRGRLVEHGGEIKPFPR